jgi:hypothetical protein
LRCKGIRNPFVSGVGRGPCAERCEGAGGRCKEIGILLSVAVC